jgi:hypothetical protein
MAAACRTVCEANQRGNKEKRETCGTGGGAGARGVGEGCGGGLAAVLDGRFESRFFDLAMEN